MWLNNINDFLGDLFSTARNCKPIVYKSNFHSMRKIAIVDDQANLEINSFHFSADALKS